LAASFSALALAFCAALSFFLYSLRVVGKGDWKGQGFGSGASRSGKGIGAVKNATVWRLFARTRSNRRRRSGRGEAPSVAP
jgi:hypothetical protein